MATTNPILTSSWSLIVTAGRILILSVLGFFGLLILGNWLALELFAWLSAA